MTGYVTDCAILTQCMKGQVTRKIVFVGETSTGFLLRLRWEYDSLLPILTELLDISDINLLSYIEAEIYLTSLFPEMIPQNTTFPSALGGEYTTTADAYIKDLDMDDIRQPLEGYPDQALIWGVEARYSYQIANDPEDPLEGTPDWEYPPPNSGRLYVPREGFPSIFPTSYFRWTTIGTEGINTTFSPPHGLLLTPGSAEAYATINFGFDGSAGVSGTDYGIWNTYEGKLPIQYMRDSINGLSGFQARLTYAGGLRYLEWRTDPGYYLGGTDWGFYFKRQTPSQATVSFPLLFGLLAVPQVNEWLKISVATGYKEMPVGSAGSLPIGSAGGLPIGMRF